MRALSRPAFVLSLAWLAGCGTAGRRGGGNDPGGGPPVVGSCGAALAIQPADPVLAVDGKSPANVSFQVLCGADDVTAKATLTVDDARLGAFSLGGTFISSAGGAGKTTVRASYGGATTTTSLTLRATTIIVATGAPADAANRFMGAVDPTRSPDIAYPPDGVLVPPNLNELEVQFAAAGNDLFEVAFTGDALDLRVYTGCNAIGTGGTAGCGFVPDEATWKLLSSAGRGQTLNVAVRGTTRAGGGVGASGSHKLSFGDDDIQGGLYYWAASTGGIFRYDFGIRGKKAESFYDPVRAGGAICVGCHALARNGSRIAVGLNAPTPAPTLRLLEVSTRKTLFDQGGIFMMGGPGGSNFEALTPDGAKVITTESGGLTIRDAANGTLIGANPSLRNANMPDVSADGKVVVFARSPSGCIFGFCMTLSVTGASLFTAPFTGTGFGAEKAILRSGGENNYYPSFSPDGQWVVFNRASGDSFDAASARVMIVGSSGGNAIDLPTVNGDTTGHSWPKWAPFVQHFQGNVIFWITFSSRRPYGLRGGSNAQIWMAAIDTSKLAAGGDPGLPAFWLPFQDAATGNHIAQWVEKVERQPCAPTVDNQGGGCMSGETCSNGVCVPGIM